MNPPLLRLERATVRYGATLALDEVSFAVERGEVHALVGENGAGKSTLLRLVTGMTTAESGAAILAGGAVVSWAPQEPALAAELTAAEWIFLGRELCRPLGLLRRDEMRAQARTALEEVGSDVLPDAYIGSLAAAQRKQVQLARALWGRPDLLLMDEPTAALGTAETEHLFRALRQRRERGAGVLYVTHRLDELRYLADRVTVLRDGRHISSDRVADVDTNTLVRRMVGRDLAQRRGGAVTRPLPVPPPATGGGRSADAGEVVLSVEGLSVEQVDAATLQLRRGEIVGLAGLVGAGRSELLECIAGLRAAHAGRIEYAAEPVLVAEDRGAKGLIPTFSVRENLFLPAGAGWLDTRKETEQTQRWIAELGIRTAGTEAPIDSLSGGNQQKLLLARALRHEPALLLLDEPTAGVDVGAKAEIHALIRALGERGTGVLLASSDLPELLTLCDRIIALRDGRITGEVADDDATEARLGALITGTH